MKRILAIVWIAVFLLTCTVYSVAAADKTPEQLVKEAKAAIKEVTIDEVRSQSMEGSRLSSRKIAGRNYELIREGIDGVKGIGNRYTSTPCGSLTTWRLDRLSLGRYSSGSAVSVFPDRRCFERPDQFRIGSKIGQHEGAFP